MRDLVQIRNQHDKFSALNKDRSWLEIDLNNLVHNSIELKKIMNKNCNLMAVVKANAYGHGLKEVAIHLNKNGIQNFAVASIDEAVQLREYGIRGTILILGYTDISKLYQTVKYNLTQTIIDYNYAKMVNNSGCRVNVHVKIDTGMHRLGEDISNLKNILKIFTMKNLVVCGVFTHLCVSDSHDIDDVNFTKMQIQKFYNLIDFLKINKINIPYIHIQSSYGLLNYPELKVDYARIGIALYGTLSNYKDKVKIKPDLRPVLSLKSKVVLIRKVYMGEGIGYGLSFKTQKDSLVAVIPIGYADGFPRNIKSGNVLLNGYEVPIIGRICMDQLVIDVTDISEPQPGDIVTLIGKDGINEIKAEEVAFKTNTITNELLSRLGVRLGKIYIKN